MKRHAFSGTVMLLTLLLFGSPAAAMCVPFPCNDCELVSWGQLNLVIMDRSPGRVRLIPNIRLIGDAADFALVVPTPSDPVITPAPREVWSEALALTAPLGSFRQDADRFTLGCSTTTEPPVTPAGSDDAVTVHRNETIGAFLATILSSTDPAALVRYLRERNFPVDGEESLAVATLVTRGWYFTAMKLDTSNPAAQVPPGGWDNNVDPVTFTYEAGEFELPLSFLGINRGFRVPMVFYVVDDHRVTLSGFRTTYANRISEDEYQAIGTRHPWLAGYVAPGRFFTRLDRTFTGTEPMAGFLPLEQAPRDDEFRRMNSWSGIPADWLLLGAVPWLARRMRHRNCSTRGTQ
jgi:hypothetical protein